MAAESDGQISTMVSDVRPPESMATSASRVTEDESGEEPIDLSRNKDDDALRSSARRLDVPPLIPINRTILKKRWLAQAQGRPGNEDLTNPVNLPNNSPPPGCIPLSLIQAKCGTSKKRRAHEMNSRNVDESIDNSSEIKCTRDEDSRFWDLRLDRAHSVPHLRALPPLVRCKSLSESRIAPNAYSESTENDVSVLNNNRPVAWLLEQEQELQRQRLQQMQIDLAGLQQTSSSSDASDILKSVPNYDSLLCVGYYTQMLQCFQAQEMLRQFALQRQPDDQEGPLEFRGVAGGSAVEVETAAEAAVTASQGQEAADLEDRASPCQMSESTSDVEAVGAAADELELRRRANRPLTGKHVRSGTGASPATLLTLRKKIQARQQLRASSSSK